MGNHKCTDLEMVSIKTLVTMEISGREKGSLWRSYWCYLLIYLQVMSNFKVAPKKTTFFFFYISLLICWRNLFKMLQQWSNLDDKCVLQSVHQSSSNKIRIIHAKFFIMFLNILIYILNHTLDNMKYLSFRQVWTRKQMHSLNIEQFSELKINTERTLWLKYLGHC